MKVTVGSTYRHAQLTVEIPAGLAVVRAANLPPDSNIKYWLDELTPEMQANPEIESWYRNYGFGFTEEEVKPYSEKLRITLEVEVELDADAEVVRHYRATGEKLDSILFSAERAQGKLIEIFKKHGKRLKSIVYLPVDIYEKIK